MEREIAVFVSDGSETVSMDAKHGLKSWVRMRASGVVWVLRHAHRMHCKNCLPARSCWAALCSLCTVLSRCCCINRWYISRQACSNSYAHAVGCSGLVWCQNTQGYNYSMCTTQAINVGAAKCAELPCTPHVSDNNTRLNRNRTSRDRHPAGQSAADSYTSVTPTQPHMLSHTANCHVRIMP